MANEQSAGSVNFVIGNSQTIYLGAAVTISGGYVVPATTTSKILGVVIGLVDRYDRPLDTTFTAVKNYTGTFTNGGPGVQNYASSSTNATGDMVKAKIIVDQDTLYVNATQSALTAANLFNFFRIRTATNATQLATYVNGDVTQFQLIKLDPDSTGDTTQGLFRIAQSIFDGYLQS